MKFDIEQEVERIHDVKELKQHISPLYCIDSYTVNKKVYEEFKDRITRIMIGAIWKEELREYPIKFKFYKDDTKTHQVELRHFLANTFLWQGLVELHGIHVADESFILTPENVVDVNTFIYKTIIMSLEKYNVDQRKINRYSANIVYDLNSISLMFSFIMGLSYSDHDFIQMYDEYKDLMEAEFSDKMQPVEIEEGLDRIENEIVRRLKADPDNPIGVILRAGGGMKTKQLREFMGLVGLRPTLTNEVIAHPINNSLLVKGLDRPSYMFIDALGARKPAIANNKDMGPIGYFAKALNMAARTLEVSRRTADCGTRHLVTYEVKTKNHLGLLEGKFMWDEDMEDYRVIRNTDRHLIGKKVKVRSITTCACGENHMCAVCIGNSVNLNWDIAEGFGVYITEEYSKDVEQNTLSTKHLLTTNSEKLEFSEEFNRMFMLVGDEIHLLDGIEGIKDLMICINPDEIKKIEEFDPNSTYNNYIDTGRFQIVNMKTGEAKEAKILAGKKLYIRTEMFDIMNADGEILLKNIDEDTPLFEVSIENNELVKPFYDLKNLVDSASRDYLEDGVTIDAISQKLMDIFVEARIKLTIASGEIILNRICRKPGNPGKRPNFGKRKLPPYEFFSLSQILERNDSPTVGFIYEQLLRQMNRLDIDERNSTSFIDPMFKEDVSMEPLMRHREALMRDEENKK